LGVVGKNVFLPAFFNYVYMNKLEHISCPSCHGTRIHQVLTCTDYYATKETFDIYRCDDCHFTFTQGVPVEAEIGRYYASPDYISHSDTRKGAMNTIYHWVRSIMLRRKARLVQRMSGKNDGRLLDIGTGTGYFPHEMQCQGWTVDAMEKNAQARTFAKEHFGLDVMAEDAWDELKGRPYDVITLWHVMEHLEHLDATWDRLAQLLDKDGTLIIAVPNCSSYDAKIYGNQWAAYDVPRHLWHFTPATIEAFGQRHGFRLTACRPMPFDAYYVSMLSEKDMHHSCSFWRGLINGFRCQLHTLGNKKLSSSMIYIFRK
jgi:protein-L-isoaspartate O-methyltransferase